MSNFMIDNTAKKKGFVLMTVIAFSIIMAASMLALFTAISATNRVAGIGEVDRIKGYYAAMAGLRYSTIMLREDSVLGSLASAGSTAEYDIDKTHYGAFYNDLGLSAPHKIHIYIINNGDDVNGNITYTVKSTYT